MVGSSSSYFSNKLRLFNITVIVKDELIIGKLTMNVDNVKKIHVTQNQPEFSKRNRFTYIKYKRKFRKHCAPYFILRE